MELRELVKDMPQTELVYLKDSYMKKMKAQVIKVQLEKKRDVYLILNKTIFHPQNGGQPADTGIINSQDFKVQIKKVMMVDGIVVHWGRIEEGKPEESEVQCEINWLSRYTYMRRHTASHLLDYCLNKATDKIFETFGSWLGSQCYIGYKGLTPPFNTILEAVKIGNTVIEKGEEVKIQTITHKELLSRASNAPNLSRLPILDFYRIVTIHGFNPIPCAGTHVNNTHEIGKIILLNVDSSSSQFKLYYDVQ